MDEKYQQLIEALASKLGTTAEHLWGVLVRQAPISASVDIVLCVLSVVFSWWFLLLVIRKTKTPDKTEENYYPRAEWSDDVSPVAWIFACGFLAITAISIFGSAQGIVTAFANPEYWALKELLK